MDEGVAVAGRDPRPEPAVLAEREHLGPVLAGDVGGAVGRAVVDDEDVDVGKLGVELVEDPGRFASSFQAGTKTTVFTPSL